MGLEELLLTESLRNTLAEAYAAKSAYCREVERRAGHVLADGDLVLAVAEAKDTFEFRVEKAFRDLLILAERLGLPILRGEIAEVRTAHKDLTHLVPTDYDIELHSPPLADAWKFFESLATMTAGRELSGLGVFETLLRNTGRLISDRGLEPANEAQVRGEIFKVLKLAFHDVAREIPLHKPLKVYKPDIGVPGLLAAAEYKFIDTEQEAKTAVGGIYEDMRGYSARHDWRSFYAVFYMTSDFFSQRELDTEWRLVKADLNWTPIVVQGPGARKGKGKTGNS